MGTIVNICRTVWILTAIQFAIGSGSAAIASAHTLHVKTKHVSSQSAHGEATYSLFVYQNGVPVNVTDVYSYDEAHLFNAVGEIVGYREPGDDIDFYDADGNIIGYLQAN